MKQPGPLERRQLAKRPGVIECIACGGSGAASRGGTCKPCQGSGSLRDGVSVAVEGSNPVFLPQHSSATAEHYTPADIVARAHATLGGAGVQGDVLLLRALPDSPLAHQLINRRHLQNLVNLSACWFTALFLLNGSVS